MMGYMLQRHLKCVSEPSLHSTGVSLDDVGVILADVADQDSLNKMAAQSTIVINCVGPVSLSLSL